MKKIILTIIFSFLFAAPALAHQPRLIWDSSGQINIESPQISKAYYDELKGGTRIYKFNLAEPAEIYLNVLIPDIAGVQKNYSVDVFRDGASYSRLNGENFEWTQFYEEFGGDNYWKGPELKSELAKGEYTLVVSNPGNTGKYVLAVGDIESFPIGESLKTITGLPSLKKDFFNKSPFSAYNNYIGLFMAGIILILAGLITAIVLIVKKIKKRK
jgi:hypothetical protein